MKITVPAEVIRAYYPSRDELEDPRLDACRCPIATALKAAGHKDVFVSQLGAEFDGVWYSNDAIRDFVRKADTGGFHYEQQYEDVEVDLGEPKGEVGRAPAVYKCYECGKFKSMKGDQERVGYLLASAHILQNDIIELTCWDCVGGYEPGLLER